MEVTGAACSFLRLQREARGEAWGLNCDLPVVHVTYMSLQSNSDDSLDHSTLEILSNMDCLDLDYTVNLGWANSSPTQPFLDSSWVPKLSHDHP